MTRYWTCHWQFRFWRPEVNRENHPLRSSGSNSFHKRGVSVGDAVYIVSLGDGQMYLGGRMTVKRIVSRDDAVGMFNNPNFYDAKDWIVDPEESGTLLHLHRRLAPEISRQLRFVSPGTEPKGLFFVSDTHLDNQTTRGVRELTPESAAFLDRIIEFTDSLPRSGQLLTVTETLLAGEDAPPHVEEFKLAEEVPEGAVYREGIVQRIPVNRYERDPRAREACKRHYGTQCFLCGFDFVEVYGEFMSDFIHVHYLKPLSSVGETYAVDPVKDLRPVCPNCHAVLHRREPPFSLDEVRGFLQSQAARRKKRRT